MAWVWHRSKENSEWGAVIDYEASAPMNSSEDYSSEPLDPKLRPVFRSSTGLKKFKKYHCPPIWVTPAVDHIWKEIILEFVPVDRVQFLPIRLIARGEICDDFMWVIPFDRVRCIDTIKSDITRKMDKPDITYIFGVRKFIHKPNCLGPLHLARDEQMLSHLLVSDELKDALSASGEDNMFYQPEDVVTIDNMFNRPTKPLTH